MLIKAKPFPRYFLALLIIAITFCSVCGAQTPQQLAEEIMTATGVQGGLVVHFGSGDVRLYDELLHIEANFEVGPGPKYHVYLVPDEGVTPQTDVAATMFVDLGRLKAFSGSQNYAIPTGTNLKNYGSVVVWCEQFGVLITPATIQHR